MLFVLPIFLASIPYLYYLIKTQEIPNTPIKSQKRSPPISVVINAYKEKNIEERIKNVLSSKYSGEMTVYILNDGSDTFTTDVCKKYPVKLMNFQNRVGKTNCMNHFLNISPTEYIIFTDADVINEKDTFKNLITALIPSDVGAVCGEVKVLTSKKNTPEKFESSYRSMYGKMCAVDISNTGSTYNFNGQIMGVKKTAVPHISLRGADDANVAIKCITNGYKAIYDPSAIVYEPQPKTMYAQFKQKTRRANGLVTSTFHVKGFFMRKYMLIASPLLLLAGLIILFIECWWLALITLGLASLFVAINPNNLLSSFIVNQICLLIGLFNRKNISIWKPVNKLSGDKTRN